MHSFEVPLDKGNLVVQYDTVQMSATCGGVLMVKCMTFVLVLYYTYKYFNMCQTFHRPHSAKIISKKPHLFTNSIFVSLSCTTCSGNTSQNCTVKQWNEENFNSNLTLKIKSLP